MRPDHTVQLHGSCHFNDSPRDCSLFLEHDGYAGTVSRRSLAAVNYHSCFWESVNTALVHMSGRLVSFLRLDLLYDVLVPSGSCGRQTDEGLAMVACNIHDFFGSPMEILRYASICDVATGS